MSVTVFFDLVLELRKQFPTAPWVDDFVTLLSPHPMNQEQESRAFANRFCGTNHETLTFASCTPN